MHRIEGQIADQKELAKDVLMWIICTRRPLNTSELRTALAVEVGENEFDEDNLPEIEDMVSVCAGLVIVDEESNIIRLVHYTTQEYFERTQDRWFPNAETGITISCVTYVSFLPFQSGILTNDKELDSRLKSNPLYAYAATYWGQHAYKAFESSSNNTSSRLCQQVLAFLENPALVESSSQLVANVGQHFWYTFRNTLFLKNVRGVHLAAHFGLGSVVMELIRRGQSPDLKDSYGRSALEWAATNGQAGVVKALLDVFGVDCDLRDFSGRTPLSQAAENGEDAVVRLLLDSGKVDVNSQDNYGRTPLSWAAENGRESTVSLLLGNDLVNVDCTDRTSRTPLMWAAAKGHAGVAQLLLDTGKVDVNARDMLGESALDRSGMKDLVVGGRRP